MNILCETTELVALYEYETVILKDKASGELLFEDWFYGEPECGLIDNNNEWAIIAGEHLVVWTPKKSFTVKNEGLKWVHSIRFKNESVAEILIDPWSDSASIWEIDLQTFVAIKLKEFEVYKGKEYTEDVKW